MGDPAKWPKTYRYGGEEYEIESPEALEAAQRATRGMLEEVVDAGPDDDEPDAGRYDAAGPQPTPQHDAGADPYAPVDAPRVPAAGQSSEPPRRRSTMVIGEPEVISRTPAERPFLEIGEVSFNEPDVVDVGEDDWLRKAYEGGVEAPVRGFNKALLSGSSDEIGAGLGSLIFGSADDLEQRLAYERARDEYTENAYPIPFGIGRGLGYAPGLLANVGKQAAVQLGKLTISPEAVAAIKRLGVNALEGYAEGAGSSNQPSVDQVLEDAGWGTLWSTGVGILGEGLAQLGPLVRGLGVAQRRQSAAPGTAADLKQIRKRKGIDYMEQGIDEAFDEYGLASSPIPQSAADVKRKLGPLKDEVGKPGMLQEAGEQLGDALASAGEQGVRGDWGTVTRDIEDEAADLMMSAPRPSDPTKAQATALRRVAYSLPQPEVLKMDLDGPSYGMLEPFSPTPRELHRQKMDWQSAGDYGPDVSKAPSDEILAQAYQQGARKLGSHLDEAMQGAPGLYGDYTRANRAYQDLAQFSDMAGDQADKVKSRTMLRSPFMYGPGAAGTAAGAAFAHQLGLGPVAGGVAGGLSALGASTLGQKYGQDVVGLGLMGTGKLMTGVGDVAQKAGPRVGPRSSLNEASVTDAAINAMSGNREALDRYSPRFRDAMAASDPKSAVSTLITELVQTDPAFREYVLPWLRTQATQQR